MESSADDPEKSLVAQDMLREMASLSTINQQQQQSDTDTKPPPTQLHGLLTSSERPVFVQNKDRLTLPITILPPNVTPNLAGNITPVIVAPVSDPAETIATPS